MDRVEETLPGIGIFLKEFLAREDLSPLAEKMRSYYVTMMDESASSLMQSDEIVRRRKSQRKLKTNSLVDFKDTRMLNCESASKDNEKRMSQIYFKELSDDQSDLPKNKNDFVQRVDFVGVLYKRKKLAWKKLNCLITGGIFIYFDFEAERHSGKEIDISGYTVSVTTKDGMRYSEEIRLTSANRKSYIFYAENSKNSSKWIQEFEKHVEMNTRLDQSGEALSSLSTVSTHRISDCRSDLNINEKNSKKKSKKRHKIQNFLNMMKEKIAPDSDNMAHVSHDGALYDEININHPALPRSPPPMSPCTYETLNFVENGYMDPVDCINNIKKGAENTYSETYAKPYIESPRLKNSQKTEKSSATSNVNNESSAEAVTIQKSIKSSEPLSTDKKPNTKDNSAIIACKVDRSNTKRGSGILAAADKSQSDNTTRRSDDINPTKASGSPANGRTDRPSLNGGRSDLPNIPVVSADATKARASIAPIAKTSGMAADKSISPVVGGKSLATQPDKHAACAPVNKIANKNGACKSAAVKPSTAATTATQSSNSPNRLSGYFQTKIQATGENRGNSGVGSRGSESRNTSAAGGVNGGVGGRGSLAAGGGNAGVVAKKMSVVHEKIKMFETEGNSK